MNVLNKEYQQLEENIQTLREKWSKSLEKDTLTTPEQRLAIKSFPAIPHLHITINVEQYNRFIEEFFTLLEESQPSLTEQFNKIRRLLTNEILEKWFTEAVSVNNFYFEKLAKDHGIAEWLPFFIAEHAARPFLQKLSSELSEQLHQANAQGACPACGEPPRIGVINKSGKKEITCPRCLYSWPVKKITCAHCGCEEPGKIEILKIEKDERAEIYVCHQCKGYTKVIDTRKLIKLDPIPLLDIKSIHLDYVAQENGFGIPEMKGTH